jgi:prevent-host-death family protein
MPTVNIYEAKTHFSMLVKRVRAGQEIIIADAGTPVARLVPIEPPRAPRVLGEYRGALRIAPDAFDPLAEEVAEWEEGPIFPESKRPPVATRPTRKRRRAGR